MGKAGSWEGETKLSSSLTLSPNRKRLYPEHISPWYCPWFSDISLEKQREGTSVCFSGFCSQCYNIPSLPQFYHFFHPSKKSLRTAHWSFWLSYGVHCFSLSNAGWLGFCSPCDQGQTPAAGAQGWAQAPRPSCGVQKPWLPKCWQVLYPLCSSLQVEGVVPDKLDMKPTAVVKFEYCEVTLESLKMSLPAKKNPASRVTQRKATHQ